MFGFIRDKAAALARGAGALGAGVAGRATDKLAGAFRAPEPPPPPPLPPLPPAPGMRHVAEKPQHLTRQGWGEVVVKLWEETARDRLMLVAAGVAFFTLLAIFPALSAIVAVWSLFGDPQKLAGAIGDIAFILPPGGVELLQHQAELVAAQGQRDLTVLIAASILISIWSANAGMKSMFEAMNIIYREDEKRSFIALNFWSLLFTLGAFAIFIATFLFLVAVPIVFAWADLRSWWIEFLAVTRWPALFAITVAFLTLLNRYGPSRARDRARWSVWGSTLGAFMWLAVSVVFSIYVADVGNLAATYGSLAAIAGLMTWLWLSALVILVGVELNAELERRTDRWEEEERRRRMPVAPPPPPPRGGLPGLLDKWRRARAGRLPPRR